MNKTTFIPTGSANDQVKYQQFTGTFHYYQHNFGYTLTDGALTMLQDQECFWMADIITSYFSHKKIQGEEFQVWKFERQGTTDKFRVTCDDGNNNILIIQKIPYSDFKFDSVTFWEVDKVIMLPSEY